MLFSMRVRASFRFRPWRGRKPRKMKLASTRPDAPTAAVTALAPGIGQTVMPRAWAPRTSAVPGSLTEGMPASVTSEMSSPESSKSKSSSIFRGLALASSACSVRSRMREVRQQLTRATRVFGGDVPSSLQRLQRAQGDVTEIADRGADQVELAGQCVADSLSRRRRRPPRRRNSPAGDRAACPSGAPRAAARARARRRTDRRAPAR